MFMVLEPMEVQEAWLSNDVALVGFLLSGVLGSCVLIATSLALFQFATAHVSRLVCKARPQQPSYQPSYPSKSKLAAWEDADYNASAWERESSVEKQTRCPCDDGCCCESAGPARAPTPIASVQPQKPQLGADSSNRCESAAPAPAAPAPAPRAPAPTAVVQPQTPQLSADSGSQCVRFGHAPAPTPFTQAPKPGNPQLGADNKREQHLQKQLFDSRNLAESLSVVNEALRSDLDAVNSLAASRELAHELLKDSFFAMQARLVSVLTQLDVSRSEVRRLRLEIRRMKAGAGAAPTAQ